MSCISFCDIAIKVFMKNKSSEKNSSKNKITFYVIYTRNKIMSKSTKIYILMMFRARIRATRYFILHKDQNFIKLFKSFYVYPKRVNRSKRKRNRKIFHESNIYEYFLFTYCWVMSTTYDMNPYISRRE